MSERLESGTIVDGRYAVKHRIGSGGMAEVYCADDLQLGRKVALKLLYRRWAEDAEFVERFRREASSAAGLQHQNIVSVYDRGEYAGTSYIAMEFVDGRTLKAVVDQDGPLAPERAIELTLQVLRAARFAHKRGVIHRDFKPHNVIVDAEDRAKVTDFGIARAGASDMTQTGSIMGTAQYLSPEQAQGRPVSAQSDLYSIGVMLFELLTGRVPFAGDSAVAIALKQVSDVPPPPSSLNPSVSPELDAVVLRALEKDPARRFADAEEFSAALRDAGRLPAAVAPTQATAVLGAVAPPPVAESLAPPSESYAYPPAPLVLEGDEEDPRRWWIPLLAGLLVVAAVVAGLLLVTGRQRTVPDVVGSSQAAAQRTLRDEGFTTAVRRRNGTEAAGIVIAQDPEGEAKADKGSRVTLTVSAGPKLVRVPDLVGQPRMASLEKLRKLGLEPVEERRSDAGVGANRIVSTDPPAGTRVEAGKTIAVVISAGPQRVAVPSVKGDTQEEASAALIDAGFKVTVKREERDGVDPGTVLAQDPAGGTRLPRGSTVTITVAAEPKEVAVPDVVGDTQADATRTLSAAGFEVRQAQRQSENPDDDGKVLEQSPVGGGKLARGGAVTITVGSFDESQLLPGDPSTGATSP